MKAEIWAEVTCSWCRLGSPRVGHEFLAHVTVQGHDREAWDAIFRAYFGKAEPDFALTDLLSLSDELGLDRKETGRALTEHRYREQVQEEADRTPSRARLRPQPRRAHADRGPPGRARLRPRRRLLPGAPRTARITSCPHSKPSWTTPSHRRALRILTPLSPYGDIMSIQRLNHAVLYVRDVERSAGFYRSVLGFRPVFTARDAVFLQAEGSMNDHDLGLIQLGGRTDDSVARQRTVGLYHLAWEVETLVELRQIRGALVGAGALVSELDHGTTKSLYANDPDGLEFEVCWLVPAALIAEDDDKLVGDPLDLDADIRRFGADTRSGVGVSSPAEH